MNKIMLCQVNSNLAWAFKEYKKNGAIAFDLFKKVNKFFRIIRFFWMRWNLPFSAIWLSKQWVKEISSADTIVLQMSYLTMNLPRFINKRNSKTRVVAWYWDIVKKNTLPQNIKGRCELWSFDPADCRKYNMRFNHQYYFKSLITKSDVCKWDVFFCGSDCGRGRLLVDLYRKFLMLKLKINFKIINSSFSEIPAEIISEPICYADIEKCNSEAKAILEIPRPGQSGATLRLMESLFLKKKVITTNPKVMEEPFYNENNIFVIGKRPIETLNSFLNSDYDHSADEFIDKYDFNSWLGNFDS